MSGIRCVDIRARQFQNNLYIHHDRKYQGLTFADVDYLIASPYRLINSGRNPPKCACSENEVDAFDLVKQHLAL